MAVTPARIVIRRRVTDEDPDRIADLLALHSGLSKRAVKDAMVKGAVWLIRPRGPRGRVRRASTVLRCEDRVELFYDAGLLARVPPPGRCLLQNSRYSVWLKPAGLLAQGSDYGDHCSLLRQVEQARPRDDVHLVHRLDRETVGLMLLAHDREAAGLICGLFRSGAVVKRYRARVLGDVRASLGDSGLLDRAVDGRVARTEFRVLAVAAGGTDVELTLVTGRTHQIRRQLAEAGHPVLGDPRYGRGNKNREGLMLVAHTLELDCPFQGQRMRVALDPDELMP